MASSGRPTDDRVIYQEDDNGADDGNQQTVQIQSGDSAGAKVREQKATYDRTNDPKDDVEDQPPHLPC